MFALEFLSVLLLKLSLLLTIPISVCPTGPPTSPGQRKAVACDESS